MVRLKWDVEALPISGIKLPAMKHKLCLETQWLELARPTCFILPLISSSLPMSTMSLSKPNTLNPYKLDKQAKLYAANMVNTCVVNGWRAHDVWLQ